MYSKIALKNVKKSFKDYTIYFLTLTLAVCIFYSFNSIESQKALVEVSSTEGDYVTILSDVISYISVFVAIILGSLILYANNFLIKKRNRELGLYMTLGMGKSKISKILIIETIIVGILSLISGLILGLIVSQGLSILVSKLFEFKMDEYSFIISPSAISKTILYFGIMFLLVILFNTYIISKYKIIDLLKMGKKSEEIRFKNPFVYLITFILCVISLGTAYKFVLDIGLQLNDPKFLISIILGIVGTVLFFFSLAGFILYVVKRTKRIYFKNLNIFTIKQINSKVNTNFISMSVICLMLFITISVVSTGFSFKNALESGLQGATPFDASAFMYLDTDEDLRNIEDSLKIMNVKFNENDKVAYYNEYRADTKISDVLSLNDINKNVNFEVSYMKISDYNKIREINNEEPINLNNEEVIKDNLKTEFMQNNIITIIINDEFCNDKTISSSNVNINFNENNKNQSENNFVNSVDAYKNSDPDYDTVGYVIANTRNEIYEENKGETTVMLFIGIYLGIVFLISSMAVLALQQLCEASDSIERYVALKKLGADKKNINKTIFIQTLIYFSLPVVLALVHSIVGIKVANEFIMMYNKPNILGSSLITAGMFMIIYAIYFYTTYTGYKNIVKNNI